MLLSISDYKRLIGLNETISDLLALPGTTDIELPIPIAVSWPPVLGYSILEHRRIGASAPHVRHLEGKLWELRVRAEDGIARGIYVTAAGRRLVVLRVFAKKSRKTPRRALATARERMRTGGHMTKLKDLKARFMEDPEFREEYARVDEEYALIEALVRARSAANLTQAELARRLGTTPVGGRAAGGRARVAVVLRPCAATLRPPARGSPSALCRHRGSGQERAELRRVGPVQARIPGERRRPAVRLNRYGIIDKQQADPDLCLPDLRQAVASGRARADRAR